MQRFYVIVTANTTMSAMVCVHAETVAEAEQKAVRLETCDYQWEHDEGNDMRPYIAAPGECAELATD